MLGTLNHLINQSIRILWFRLQQYLCQFIPLMTLIFGDLLLLVFLLIRVSEGYLVSKLFSNVTFSLWFIKVGLEVISASKKVEFSSGSLLEIGSKLDMLAAWFIIQMSLLFVLFVYLRQIPLIAFLCSVVLRMKFGDQLHSVCTPQNATESPTRCVLVSLVYLAFPLPISLSTIGCFPGQNPIIVKANPKLPKL